MLDRTRWRLGLAVLLAQVGWNMYGRTLPTRYFQWAPFDVQNEYQIDASVAGRPLEPKEIGARYHRGAKGVEQRPIAHVFDVVRRVEAALPESERAQVTVRYSVNGAAWQEWRWP